MHGDGLNQKVGRVQKVDGMIDAFVPDIFRNRFSGLLFKYGCQITGADGLLFRQSTEGELRRYVGIDHQDRFLNHRGVLPGGMVANKAAV